MEVMILHKSTLGVNARTPLLMPIFTFCAISMVFCMRELTEVFIAQLMMGLILRISAIPSLLLKSIPCRLPDLIHQNLLVVCKIVVVLPFLEVTGIAITAEMVWGLLLTHLKKIPIME